MAYDIAEIESGGIVYLESYLYAPHVPSLLKLYIPCLLYTSDAADDRYKV